jgi:DnaJ-class molecular chaperone
MSGAADETEETRPICPQCAGEGFVVEESDDGTHKGGTCPLCHGERMVSAAELLAWREKITSPVGPARGAAR